MWYLQKSRHTSIEQNRENRNTPSQIQSTDFLQQNKDNSMDKG